MWMLLADIEMERKAKREVEWLLSLAKLKVHTKSAETLFTFRLSLSLSIKTPKHFFFYNNYCCVRRGYNYLYVYDSQHLTSHFLRDFFSLILRFPNRLCVWLFPNSDKNFKFSLISRLRYRANVWENGKIYRFVVFKKKFSCEYFSSESNPSTLLKILILRPILLI